MAESSPTGLNQKNLQAACPYCKKFGKGRWIGLLCLTVGRVQNGKRTRKYSEFFFVLLKGKKIVGKGEIARYQQFLLFPQCFQKTCTVDM